MRETAMRTVEMYHRRLNYDGMSLLPVQDRNSTSPFTRVEYADSWHVPGRTIRTTKELIDLANSRGITVTMTESSGVDSSTYRLN